MKCIVCGMPLKTSDFSTTLCNDCNPAISNDRAYEEVSPKEYVEQYFHSDGDVTEAINRVLADGVYEVKLITSLMVQGYSGVLVVYKPREVK